MLKFKVALRFCTFESAMSLKWLSAEQVKTKKDTSLSDILKCDRLKTKPQPTRSPASNNGKNFASQYGAHILFFTHQS